MDLKMPGMNGIEATRRILHDRPRTGVLMLTMFEDDDSVFAAMRAGARGYLLKDARGEQVVHAILGVAGGEAIFGPAIAQRLMDFFGAPTPGAPRRAFPQLTEREEEVLSLIAQGESNQEIAKALFLSVKTVLNHASNIFMKLQVADRAQAVIRAREAGMGREGGPESGGHALKAGRGPRSMAGTHGASRQGDASSIAT
jgi:DNA-binding NarL/FixJ family response regulator